MTSTQSTSQPTAARTTKLALTVSTSSTVLIDRFTDILEVAAPNNKDKYITAAETYQIDVHTSAMVFRLSALVILTNIGESGRGSTCCHAEVETTVDSVRGKAGERGREQWN